MMSDERPFAKFLDETPLGLEIKKFFRDLDQKLSELKTSPSRYRSVDSTATVIDDDVKALLEPKGE
jgi:hypothetical protein